MAASVAEYKSLDKKGSVNRKPRETVDCSVDRL
jgi:hypothetical protein